MKPKELLPFCSRPVGWLRPLSATLAAYAIILLAATSISGAAADTGTALMAAIEEQLTWRNVGPEIGGRSIAVAGSSARPQEAYFGATGGGLWKTVDGGETWTPVTDGQIATSSIGAVEVAPSDPDIVYIGMGESQLRANVLQGDGVYRSADAGKTWQHAGLKESQTISALRIHPQDPDTVYAAVLGSPFVPSAERGIFRTRDGGATWEKILFRSDKAGGIDLAMDPSDPNRLIATLWQVYRRPWQLSSGGPESGIYESLDGGDSWTEITDRPGLPEGPLGKMTVSISAPNPDRIYANIEAKAGGLYRSDDGGQTWAYINGAKKLWQRSFYFMRVHADPVDEDKVYILSFKLERSTDGGESFKDIPTRHVDIHDLWIDPKNPARMVVGDDGGGSMTTNDGAFWTVQDYSTAQMYRVTTTNDVPYQICGSQQDNLTYCVPSRKPQSLGALGESPEVTVVGLSEMGYVASHPQKPEVFFVGGTNSLTRFDRDSGRTVEVHPYPYIAMGQPAKTMKERWNWTFPIVFSRHEPYALYAGSQHVWRSFDEGLNWERISPDLTRADPDTLGDSGGPITFDQDGPEIYGTLYTLAPSYLDKETIWTGSDDGLIHVTRDGGASWSKVTPDGLPANSRISLIEPSRFEQGKAYAAVKRYEMGDRAPYIYATPDYGKTWTRLDAGLAEGDFVHAVREDPEQAGLLYLATELGVRVSPDGGATWRSLSLNLPVTPVTSLEVRGDDLVIATHGRSFYVLSGLSLLRQSLNNGAMEKPALFAPADVVRGLDSAMIYAWVPKGAKAARLQIRDSNDKVVKTVFKKKKLKPGLQRFKWELFHDGAALFPGMILESPLPYLGPAAAPGEYRVELSFGKNKLSAPLVVMMNTDRTGDLTEEDLQRQTALAVRARDATDTANRTVIAIRGLKKKVNGEDERSTAFRDAVTAVEAQLYQIENESPKDKIALPIQLNDRLAGMLAMLTYFEGPPTAAQAQVLGELEAELSAILEEYDSVKSAYADVLAGS
ncbi:MAG: glycosyl hydrolase [Pseudomonadota bacterium]